MKTPETEPGRRAARGFTVVEVLAAMTVFGIVAAGMAANSVAVMRANRHSRDFSAAGALAQDKMEQLRALDVASNPPDFTAGAHTDAANPITAHGQAGGMFTRQWAVTRDAPAPGVATVVVAVTWSDGATRTVRVVGYVCQSRACV